MNKSIYLKRLAEAFGLWEGTPYIAGACMQGKKGGVDCVRYVDAVLQHVHAVKLPDLPEEAQDAAFHDAEVVVRVIKLMKQRHTAFEIPTGGEFRPGDALGISFSGNPFHAVIVAMDGKSVWHAAPNGVVLSSIQAFNVNEFHIKRAYRVRALA